jgi:hypothetical protein
LNAVFVEGVISMVHDWIPNEEAFQVDICDVLLTVVVDDSHGNIWDIFASIALSRNLNLR